MPNSLRAAVIGTGAISKEHLSFIANSPLAQLVGVCDLSRIAGQYAAKRFGAEACFTNYQDMLKAVSPEVIHILTPPQTHPRIAADCLKAGAHVICEKPITLSYLEFKDLWEVAKECDRTLIEDQNYRFNEPVLQIQKLIQDGTLGEIQDVEIRLALDIRGGRFDDENLPNPIHKMPAGVIHDFITHMTYLALCFIPDLEFGKVSSHWSNHGGSPLYKYDDLDALVIDGSRHARLRFSCFTQPDAFQITVRGTRGFAETDLFLPYVRCVVPRSGGKQLSPLINHFESGKELMGASFRNFRRKIMQKTPYEGLHRLMGMTYEALLRGEAPPISFDDMARTSRFIDALLLEENHR
ncbi:MAG TPA: Gfo/Idh/MocA family oxidoreductase [Leptolyngbyaceae cyanobacterium]